MPATEYLSPEAAAENNIRYDMTEEEARQLCHNFLATPELDVPEGKFGCYEITADSDFSNLGRFVESTVFDETFDNTPELMDEQYSPYDQNSSFYVVIDHEAEMPVGVMRLIRNSEAGLKSLNDLEAAGVGFTKEDVCQGYGVNPDRCVDIATLAVLEDYRGVKAAWLPSLLTYRKLYQDILSSPDYDHVVAIIDQDAEKNLHTLKFPFEPMFGSDYFSYLDSPKSRAVIAKNSMFYPQLTYWTAKLKEEAAGREGAQEELIANTIDALINPRYLDPLISSSQAAA